MNSIYVSKNALIPNFVPEDSSGFEFCFYVKAEPIQPSSKAACLHLQWRDVTRRNPVAANQSPASSYRRLLSADRPEILSPVSTERGMPCALADIIIILSLILYTN